jgi:hypothetical protein
MRDSSASGVASRLRGRALVRAAFALLLAPTAGAVFLAIYWRTAGLPAVLLSATFVGFLLAVCYRGDPWARWIVIVFVALGTVRSLALMHAERVPWWIGVLQIAWSAAGIALLQAPASRAFLREQRARKHGLGSRPVL